MRSYIPLLFVKLNSNVPTKIDGEGGVMLLGLVIDGKADAAVTDDNRMATMSTRIAIVGISMKSAAF